MPAVQPLTCQVCGSDVGQLDRLCSECDAPLVPPERRVVTILFADLSGYTALCQDLDPETVQLLVHPLMRRLRRSAEDRGALVPGVQGDGFMAVFGVPVTHEDDAARALATAADLQLIVSSWDVTAVGTASELVLHVSVHSGEVLAAASRDIGGWSVTGDVVNVASRLCDASGPGEILVSSAARDLSRVRQGWLDDREVSLRGRRDPVMVSGWSWREHSLEPGRQLRWDAALVDRHEPRAALDAYRSSPAGCCLALVGEPGVGKTRLLVDWSAQQNGWLVIRGRTRAFGASSWWEPLEDALRSLAGADGLARLLATGGLECGEQPLLERRLARMLGLVDTVETDSAADLVAAFGEFLRLAADKQPVIVHLDDVHDAGDSLVAAAEGFMRLTTAHPLLVVMTSRPEFSFPESIEIVRLQPLSASYGELLIRELLPGLPEGVAARLHERVGGNPYYAEECTQFIRDESYLYLDRPTVPDAALERLLAEPTTMRTFVTARVDRLAEPERRMLEVLAIAAEKAPLELITFLSATAEPETHLASLIGRGLLSVSQTTSAPRFRHGLTREIVQATMSAQRRGALHDQAHKWYDAELDRLGSGSQHLGLVAARAEHAVAAWEAGAQIGGRGGSDCEKARRAVAELLAWCEPLVTLEPGAADAVSKRASAIVDLAPTCISDELKLSLLHQRAICALELGNNRLAREFLVEADTYGDHLGASTRLRSQFIDARLLTYEGNVQGARSRLQDLAEQTLMSGEPKLHLDTTYALAQTSEDASSGVDAFTAVFEAAVQRGDQAIQSSSALMAATMSLMTDATTSTTWLERAESLQLPADVVGRGQSHVSRAWLALFEDRFEEALAQARSALALGRGGSAWQVEGFAALLAAEAAMRLGNLDAASRHLASIEQRVRARGRAKGLLGLTTIQTYVSALAGETARAGLLLSEAQHYDRPDAFESGTLDAVLGTILLWRGDAATAVALLRPSEEERLSAGLGLAAVPIGLNRLRAIALHKPTEVADALPGLLDSAGAAHATYALDLARLIAAHARAVSGGPVVEVNDPGFEGSEPFALLCELRAIQQARDDDAHAVVTLQVALEAWSMLGHTAWRVRCGFWLAEVTGDEGHAGRARDLMKRLESPSGLEQLFRSQWLTALESRS